MSTLNLVELYRQVQATYDRIVLDFAERNHFHMAENLVRLAGELAGHVGPDGRLVDLGCGTGRDLAWFETHGVASIGIDLSMGMLGYASEQVHAGLACMNLRALGLGSACFDGAWCCASLLHLPKAEAVHALREMRRLLRSGGMLILSVQEGDGEGWEEGSIPGARRYFARYREGELRGLLTRGRFAVRRCEASQTPERDWLSFVCLAE